MSTVVQFGDNTTTVKADNTVRTWSDETRNGQVDRGYIVTCNEQSEGKVFSYEVAGGEALKVSAGGRETKMWDVFFDARSDTQTQR